MKVGRIQRKTIAMLVAGACLGTSLYTLPEAKAEGFIDDSTLTGGVYYWQRERDRKDLTADSKHYGEYTNNLSHATFNANLDYSSGYLADFFGVDLAVFGALEVADDSAAHPNEIAFSKGHSTWREDWSGDKSGISLYKAAAKFKLGDFWARGGYLQPSGQTLMAPHWSFMPGTYRGAEAGAKFDYGDNGALSFSYMWADQYKAPWNQHMAKFRQADKKTRVAYLHSLGAKYDFKNDLILEAAVGQAEGFMNQFFAKGSYDFLVADNKLRTSYQFYGAKDRVGKDNASDVYDSLAWLQALTFGYEVGPLDFRLEGTWVKATGKQGFFLQRMTPSYASSNGRLDIWWDSRSDFNADGEKALYAGVMYNLKNWNLPEWSVGTSYAYGWDARPSTVPDQNDKFYNRGYRLKESAINFDIVYTIQEGVAKGTSFKLHHTRYNNHSNIPSWSGGYGNIFQDEKDVKFIVIAPFTIF